MAGARLLLLMTLPVLLGTSKKRRCWAVGIACDEGEVEDGGEDGWQGYDGEGGGMRGCRCGCQCGCQCQCG